MNYMDSNLQIDEIIKNVEKASSERNTDFFCTTRDVFQARLDSFTFNTNFYLLAAIIGEIGNNTFDHNWEYEKSHMRGVYFSQKDDYIVLADFGRGIKSSLSSVRKCSSDLEAVRTAFTEQISGRAPEQRGNGLKFVKESVLNKNWYLYFQSGKAVCLINKCSVNFSEVNFSFDGCLAVIKTGDLEYEH